jgi:hypothetical protein
VNGRYPVSLLAVSSFPVSPFSALLVNFGLEQGRGKIVNRKRAILAVMRLQYGLTMGVDKGYGLWAPSHFGMSQRHEGRSAKQCVARTIASLVPGVLIQNPVGVRERSSVDRASGSRVIGVCGITSRLHASLEPVHGGTLASSWS